jgi:hypothetical protein
MMRNLQFTLLLAGLAAAQEPASPPAVPQGPSSSGQPIAVAFHCSEEDILWAGMVCSAKEPCPVYLEISAVGSAGERIFAAGNIHSSAITLYSVLLSSDDDGHTWREAHERIRGAALDHLQFVGSQNGWIGGQSLSPLVQDPFLLITTDAGQSWRQQAIFGETRVGSIVEFYFSDKSEGSLLFDRGRGAEGGRYEVYESHDGGASWTIKEESAKLPPLKGAPPPPGWRVGADGPTRSFLIERRSGDRWNRVAALPVDLGDCKPGEPE